MLNGVAAHPLAGLKPDALACASGSQSDSRSLARRARISGPLEHKIKSAIPNANPVIVQLDALLLFDRGHVT